MEFFDKVDLSLLLYLFYHFTIRMAFLIFKIILLVIIQYNQIYFVAHIFLALVIGRSSRDAPPPFIFSNSLFLQLQDVPDLLCIFAA